MLERFFGPTITSSTGRIVPVRLIGISVSSRASPTGRSAFAPGFGWVVAQPIHKLVDPFAVTSGASTDHAPTAPLPLNATAAETPQRS